MMAIFRRTGAIMSDMGTFRITIRVGHPTDESRTAELSDVLVDTGSELTWVPSATLESLGIVRRKTMRFRQADGTVLERATGVGIVHAVGTSAGEEVVFAEPGDMTLLGARSLEGLNLTIDPVLKRLVDAGPAPAATAA
jgi:predicted aspartyl protease